jgi:hypothetical protein
MAHHHQTLHPYCFLGNFTGPVTPKILNFYFAYSPVIPYIKR